MEEWAHKTLTLSSYRRRWLPSEPPDAYYRFTRGELSFTELMASAGVERDQIEWEAWRATLGETPESQVDGRIRSALQGREDWVLVGGPPCQAYSVVGRVRRRRVDPSFESDPKHFLYQEYLRILIEHRPPVFLMENVRGILSATINGERVFDKIVRDMELAGYRLYPCGRSTSESGKMNGTEFLLKSEDYGIPQRRHRVIVMGVRNDVPDVIAKLMVPVDSQMPVRTALRGLPRLRSKISKEPDSSEAWMKIIRETDWAKLVRTAPDADPDVAESVAMIADTVTAARLNSRPLRTVSQDRAAPAWARDQSLDIHCNHEPRSHIPDDIRRYFFAAAWAQTVGHSPRLENFPPSLLPLHENVQRGVKGEMFSDRFRVQVADVPSTTITSHISKDGHYFIHPDPTQARSLTVREAARLQTFPDNYYFMGGRTAQYRQVGNAVPPALGRSLALVVHQVLLTLPVTRRRLGAVS